MGMNVVEVNEGKKIQYTVSKTKIAFDDELILNVEKLERDFPVTVDICIDKFGMVVNGLGVKYAAQIEVPARAYGEKEIDNPQYEEGSEQPKRISVPDPQPFSMDRVTLKLYAID